MIASNSSFRDNSTVMIIVAVNNCVTSNSTMTIPTPVEWQNEISDYVYIVDFPDIKIEAPWERREKVKWPIREYIKPVQTRLLKPKRYYSGFMSETRGRHTVVKLNNSRNN